MPEADQLGIFDHERNAVISPCGRYRYWLRRKLDGAGGRAAVFAMLNPSTADADTDDPTIRRCRGFALRIGCTELIVVNLFAFRATQPSQLLGDADPVGPDKHGRGAPCAAPDRRRDAWPPAVSAERVDANRMEKGAAVKRATGDEYGFLAAARAGTLMFELGGRRTGRTMRLIERVQDGDCIITSDPREQHRLQQLLREAGKPGVAVYFCEATHAPMSRIARRSSGRAYFDHGWVLQFVLTSIERASRDLDDFHAAISKTWPAEPNRQRDDPDQRKKRYLEHGQW